MSGDQVKEVTSTPPAPVAVDRSAGTATSRVASSSAGDVADDQAPAREEPATIAASPWSVWSNLWQVPSLLISVTLIVWGLYFAAKPALPNDFEGALTQVEQFIAAGQNDLAKAQLQEVIEPHLAAATPAQQARFHAAVGDYLSVSRQEGSERDTALNRQVADHYQKAADLGRELSPLQRERWAGTLLALDDSTAARKQLAELETLRDAARGDARTIADAAAGFNRVFRSVIETDLRKGDRPFDELMTALAEYRLEGNIAPDDELWAIARQTELRLDTGQALSAVDLLLLEMRRLEVRLPSSEHVNYGELYGLLGRGYFELGDYVRGQRHLEHAVALFDGPEPAHGDALVLLGQMAVSVGDPDAALEHFQLVVRDFITTRSYLPGLLGLAEVQSVLGSHEESLADYRMVCEQVRTSGTRRDVTPQRVADSLCDRYDAVLALGRVERALDYVALAEGLFAADHVPGIVLFRLASANRQLADNLIAQASTNAESEPAPDASHLDPAIRHEANVHLERAGAYFIRHAGAEPGSSSSIGEDAATSLWLAADCYDLAGRQDQAIVEFVNYLERQSIDDPRRAETLYRLAQAHQARMEYEDASRYYEQLIADRGRSAFATQSYVPLARCHVALNHVPEARQLLQQVLSGSRLLQPDAASYRDALMELGRIEYEIHNHTAAIEALTEFLQRYPADSRTMEVRYLLADSYRANAMAVAERVKQDESMSPSESGRLNTIFSEQLQTAQSLFAQVVEEGEAADAAAPPWQQDQIRRAALYQADCAFALGQYPQAVEMYDHAARRYSDSQGSLYALIQIVNAYNALGDTERAAAAHHRALVRLKQLPDDAFAAPDGLMDRTAWERWLENNPVGPARTASANATSG